MNESKRESVRHTFAPIFNCESKILILGTFPSVKSRETEFYYGHPQNRFWKVIASVFACKIPETIEDKKRMLLDSKIAVWDVIESCDIIGSSDSSIQNVVVNNLNSILNHSNVEKIYANGKLAGRLYEKYSKKVTGREIVVLPSTSPANAAYSLNHLCEEWEIIKNLI